MTARRNGLLQITNQDAMPLENLGAYVSDSGSSIHPRNSDSLPECRQYDSDPHATAADSQVDRTELTVTEAQKIRRAV